MDIEKVVKQLKVKYPGKNIFLDDKDGYQEIICEVDPTSDHPDFSTAVVVVGKGRAHFHKYTKEIYEVIRGRLCVYLKGEKNMLKKGEKIKIPLNTLHYPEGDETWFYTYSTPGWTPEDHILV